MITVLGASGFIGSHVVAHLEREGVEHHAIPREALLPDRPLGHIIYCIGVTADFAERPYECVEAHVGTLLDVIRDASFDSLLYLSSTRVYSGRGGVAYESDDLIVNPSSADHLYNISKVMGESIVATLAERGRVARLSHVYGRRQSESFLQSILRDAERGATHLRSSPFDARDYVHVDAVAQVLVKIALGGRERIYNVASGYGITNADLLAAIARQTGCKVTFASDVDRTIEPRIDIDRIRSEFAFEGTRLLEDLPSLIGSRA